MKKHSAISRTILAITAGAAFASLIGCADLDLNRPYPPNGGYYDPGYDSGYRYGRHDDDGYYRNRNRHEEREIERERDRLEHERRELQEERERHEREERDRHESRYTPPPRHEERQEHCPPGYQESERKCSPEERRRGCKDVRLNTGIGCVHR